MYNVVQLDSSVEGSGPRGGPEPLGLEPSQHVNSTEALELKQLKQLGGAGLHVGFMACLGVRMEAARMSFVSAMPSIADQEPRHHVSQRSGKGADFEGVYARL